MNPRTDKSKIAAVQYNRRCFWYVNSLPGCSTADHRAPVGSSERNCDWGYTDKASKALPLSPYWQRRFIADSRRCGREPHFYDVRAV